MSRSSLAAKILQNALLPIEPCSKVVHGDGVGVPEPYYGKLAGVDSAPNLLVIGAEQTRSLLYSDGDRRRQFLGAVDIEMPCCWGLEVRFVSCSEQI
jgi:hypothetical protein